MNIIQARKKKILRIKKIDYSIPQEKYIFKFFS